MTDDKRKKLESCFDSLEKIVSLRDTLTEATDSVSTNLEWAIERLGENRLIDGSETDDSELKEGLIKLDDTPVESICGGWSPTLSNFHLRPIVSPQPFHHL